MNASEKFVFFDNINTTFLDPQVAEVIRETLTSRLGNPSSHVHSAGIRAGAIIDRAREKVAALINGSEGSLIFTSGATEANNLAVSGFLKANPNFRFVCSPIEHFSIVNQVQELRRTGIETGVLNIDPSGSVDLTSLKKTVENAPALVSVAPANPEIGTIQDISAISEICHENGCILHCDCAASAGLMEIDVLSMGIDLLTLSAHNMHGPMGVGALYLSDEVRIAPIMAGGNQESGLRPGTENIPGIAGMGVACLLAADGLEERSKELKALGVKLRNGLAESVPFVHFTGHEEKRLPGHVSFWIEHVEGESLLLFLNMNGVMASSGSACSSNLKARDETELRASHVLSAIGVPSDICAGSITFSMGRYNTADEVDYVLEVMPGIVGRLLEMSPSYEDYRKGKEKHHG